MNLERAALMLFLSGCMSFRPMSHRSEAASPNGGPPAATAPREAGVLTAGHWRDLDHWDFWNGALQGPLAQVAGDWGLDLSSRIAVHVTGTEGPAADVVVTVRDATEQPIASARTDVRGHAELFTANARPPFSIEVTDGKRRALFGPVIAPREPIAVALPDAAAPPPQLDLMFVIDTTGSMGDELSYLSTELVNVVGRVQRNHPELAIRISPNFYRDEGDDYVVRSNPFTEDVRAAADALSAERAAGGGDFPEAVEAALADAIDRHAWSDRARARLLFLVLDAPPHRDPQRLQTLARVAARAANLGVRIIPVASSGVDQSTEVLLRQLAIATAGSYTFLTDHSGVGNSHLEPTIGAYDVEKLNDLLVRLIDDAVRAGDPVAAR